MVIRLRKMRLVIGIAAFVAAVVCLFVAYNSVSAESEPEKKYIKWAEMNVSYQALKDTMELDIDTYDKLYHISWIDSLSYLACKNGNNWSAYKSSQLKNMVETLGDSYTIEDLIGDNKYFSYYQQTFSAALGGLLGEYEKQAPDSDGGKIIKKGYGLVAYSPIAEGFGYNHYDDFGNSRTYGYRRTHLGNDLLGNVGTPIVAVEGGIVECYGWNQYGGWRLGIRSFDGKRSYYYAHLRKDRPYHSDIKLGSKVKAGQVIGYLGMTGYSTNENVNGMTVPHLHFGMQLIFDESQKEGTNQIWLDVYNLVKLLSVNRATVTKNEESGEWFRKYDIIDKRYPSELQKYINEDE
ncbi:MAG: M23 family metallopeptidase [Faecalibacterium sp.]|nr:M23 family metallopeptidase [Ruminococcus sp.]MCM1393254.1 M23 family metallopeptidase [Ruminococcus sp.]MCM1486714.1 M23 family metallopeptidase [Faecalibacterium sp.]